MLMGCLKSLGYLYGKINRLHRLYSTVGLYIFLEGGSLHKLHYYIIYSVVLTDIVYIHNIRM